jgi:ATP-dependent DNA helicase RecQ
MPNDKAQQLLKEVFGFEQFRQGQDEVIQQLSQGNSALAVFPTGSGKSLCYQLSALLFEGLSIVVSPLIALMKDQVDFLHSKNIAAAKIDSTLSFDELKKVWNDIEQNRLKLLYIAPERFANEKFLQRLMKARISMMVIDEAHCMSEWGHNFRPDYLKLNGYIKILKAERVLALTATATPNVASDICKTFNIQPQAYVNTGYYRPNLTIRMTRCNTENKIGLLQKRLQENPAGATIVYVTLQKEAEDVAQKLLDFGHNALAYHAGMKGDIRHDIQEKFMASKDAIVVATIAFGMGIDKANIRYVYHLNTPKSMENYAQEIGRAGRDGENSICEVFASQQDATVLANFTYGDTPTLEGIVGIVTELLTKEKDFDVSIYHLSGRHDIRPLVINTLLCYLELKGIIQSTGYFYNNFKFQPLISSKEILAKFDPERAQFLKTIFLNAKKGRLWFSLSISELVKVTGTERQRITSALNYLDNEGMIKTQVSEARATFKRLTEVENLTELAQELQQRFAESETRDVGRLNKLIELTKSSTCLVNSMLEYFGENLAQACGHCDRCLNNTENYEEITDLPSLSDTDLQIICEVKALNNDLLSSPRNLAKFLCGISSPATSRCRPALSKHQYFGALKHVPFELIMQV